MKIVPVILKYDYGQKERGYSGEKMFFLPALSQIADEVKPFWLEENGYPDEIFSLQSRILDFISLEKPDIVFFMLMNNEISLDTIEKISSKYFTINWFCDDQWRFEDFTRYVAPKLTYSITVDKYSVPKYHKMGCNVILSQWATFDYTENINFDNNEYNYDISFVGGINTNREWHINELVKSGYQVNCFGQGWKNGRMEPEDIKHIFLTSKINLNLSNSVSYDKRYRRYLLRSFFKSFIEIKTRNPYQYLKSVKRNIRDYLFIDYNPKRIEQIKARNFEIPGCGGFQLSQYALEIEDYYDIGREIAVFSNIDDLKRQLDYYLQNNEIRERIKIAGYKKTKSYTYVERLTKVFNEIKMKF